MAAHPIVIATVFPPDIRAETKAVQSEFFLVSGRRRSAVEMSGWLLAAGWKPGP
jgi:hypothetical protein